MSGYRIKKLLNKVLLSIKNPALYCYRVHSNIVSWVAYQLLGICIEYPRLILYAICCCYLLNMPPESSSVNICQIGQVSIDSFILAHVKHTSKYNHRRICTFLYNMSRYCPDIFQLLFQLHVSKEMTQVIHRWIYRTFVLALIFSGC